MVHLLRNRNLRNRRSQIMNVPKLSSEWWLVIVLVVLFHYYPSGVSFLHHDNTRSSTEQLQLLFFGCVVVASPSSSISQQPTRSIGSRSFSGVVSAVDDDSKNVAFDDNDDDESSTDTNNNSIDDDPFYQLALVLKNNENKNDKKRPKFDTTTTTTSFDDDDVVVSMTPTSKLVKTLSKLASTTSTLKGLDGMAYEAYQRTHKSSNGSTSSSSSGGGGGGGSGSSGSGSGSTEDPVQEYYDDFPDNDDDYDDDEGIINVKGRAQRSLARLYAVTEALFASELVDDAMDHDLVLMDRRSAGNKVTKKNNLDTDDDDFIYKKDDDPIVLERRRQIIFNTTIQPHDGKNNEHILPVSILVLYDPNYQDGVGVDHGMTRKEGTTQPEQVKGRLLIVLSDPYATSMSSTMRTLVKDRSLQHIRLSTGLISNEVASVQRTIYATAGKVLSSIEPILQDPKYNTATAIHFVGYSLSGSVACLAATICDGSIPMPSPPKKKGNKKKKYQSKPSQQSKRSSYSKSDVGRDKVAATTNGDISLSSSTQKTKNIDKHVDGSNERTTDLTESESSIEQSQRGEEERVPLSGLGRGRSSAMSLGGPPCLSKNVPAPFCTSILFGDDVVCRTTSQSYTRLVQRVDRTLNGGFITKNFGWMSDSISLGLRGLQSHAHGSEGEEEQLTCPGKVYLLRPRRLGDDTTSIHEVGSVVTATGKTASNSIRESVLWQLNDILLSKSMWKHHLLPSYIHGLDTVQLRGTTGVSAAAS